MTLVSDKLVHAQFIRAQVVKLAGLFLGQFVPVNETTGRVVGFDFSWLDPFPVFVELIPVDSRKL